MRISAGAKAIITSLTASQSPIAQFIFSVISVFERAVITVFSFVVALIAAMYLLAQFDFLMYGKQAFDHNAGAGLLVTLELVVIGLPVAIVGACFAFSLSGRIHPR